MPQTTKPTPYTVRIVNDDGSVTVVQTSGRDPALAAGYAAEEAVEHLVDDELTPDDEYDTEVARLVDDLRSIEVFDGHLTEAELATHTPCPVE